jgi:hypothetical protein
MRRCLSLCRLCGVRPVLSQEPIRRGVHYLLWPRRMCKDTTTCLIACLCGLTSAERRSAPSVSRFLETMFIALLYSCDWWIRFDSRTSRWLTYGKSCRERRRSSLFGLKTASSTHARPFVPRAVLRPAPISHSADPVATSVCGFSSFPSPLLLLLFAAAATA